jgi:SurA-like N-terminal domain
VESAMIKKLFFMLISGLFLYLSGCAREQDENVTVLAEINDYQLTLKDFETQLASNLEFERDFKLTQKAKKQFLNNLIEKELLLQEAMKLKLDRNKKFIAAIERYWEATLIKNLMELKGKDITKSTYVSQEEIEARYGEMKRSQANLPPMEEMQKKIVKKIKEEKKNRELSQWVQDLKRNAKIEINQKLLLKN